MAYRCPQCSLAGALEIVRAIQLPPDSRSDEILLQEIGCSNCGFRGLAIYEESRRGALDSEAWDHTGYRVEATKLRSILERIESCPDPFNPACSCSAHRELGGQDGSGRWRGISGLDEEISFRMELEV